MAITNYLDGIIKGGVLHTLTNKVIRKSDGRVYTPCQLCSLRNVCDDKTDNICTRLLDATDDEYFEETANVVYDPSCHRMTIERITT